jgi:hypothetical protein
MKNAKLAQVLSGAALFLLGVSCCLSLLLIVPISDWLFVLLGADTQARWNISFSLALWAVPLPILCMEYGIYWIRKSRRMGDTQGGYPVGNIYTGIARFLLPIGMVLSGMLILASTIFIAIEMFIFGIAFIKDPGSLTQPLLIMAGLLVLYGIVRTVLWFLWRWVGKPAARQYSIGLAKYQLIEGGVEIDLNYPIQIGKPGPSRFVVRFNELEEARVMTYHETLTFLQFTVGPNIPLGLQEPRDVYQWRTGKIPRPTVHLSTAKNPFGIKVLLRGPGLFYLISFHTEDAGDLIVAFQHSRPARDQKTTTSE